MWFWQKHIRRPNRMSYKLLNQSEQQFLPTHTKSIDDDASGATGVYTTNTMATRFRFSGIQVSRESANDADFFFDYMKFKVIERTKVSDDLTICVLY